MMNAATLLLTLAAAALAEGPEEAPKTDKPPAAAKAAAAPAAATSTNPLSLSIGSTIEEIYAGATLRDPFLAVAGAAKAAAAATAPGETPVPAGTVPSEDFSIHSLELKGVMEDRTGGFAILVDPKFAASFVLKRGRLFDVRNKPIPGVTGFVKAKQKSVMLVGPGPDHDKRILTMAEKDEDDEGKAGVGDDAKGKTQ